MLKKMKATFRPGSPYMVFMLSLLFTGLSYGIYKGILDNYLAEVVGVGKLDRGVAEAFREVSGMLLIFVLAILYMFSAEGLYKLGTLIVLAGGVMICVLPANKLLVIFAMMVYSFGEHIQLGMRATLTLEYAEPERSGQALGYQSSLSQAGSLLGFLIVFFLFNAFGQPFRLFFWVSAFLILPAVYFALKINSTSKQDPSRSRFYFRRKYTKYYMLEAFYGARKQVFMTFGPYTLILFYGANAMVIALLHAVSAVLCFYFSPVVGRIIDRVGYKTVMVMDTVLLVGVCFFYGFAHHIFPMNVAFIVCCVNYVLDSIISLCSMASNVYVKDISDSPEETRATISTGISVNHVMVVMIALFGGWIWETMGMETLFVVSAITGLCNSAYAATIKVRKKAC